MESLSLDSAVQFIPGVGPKLSAKFKRLRVGSVQDLLRLLPRRYEDLSQIVPVEEAREGEAVVKGKITGKHARRTRTGKTIVEAVIADETGAIKAVWFNQRYLMTSLKDDTEYVFAGKVKSWNGVPTLESSSFEIAGVGLKHTGKIVSIYPETEGLSSRVIRNALIQVLPLIDQLPVPEVEEFSSEMPLPYREALKEIHTPSTTVRSQEAHATLAFTEMLLWELKALTLKASYQSERAAVVPYDLEFLKSVLTKLSFTLTATQKRSLHEILTELARPVPMNRLLEGDVGSGKTAVAILAGLVAARSGGQTALMVPTEILAKQHYEKQRQLIEAEGAPVLLLTGSEARFGGEKITKKRAHELIGSGQAAFIIGTHALIQEAVKFADLRLAVVDEQHRFGVGQRAKLRAENHGHLPHLLTMTATPIPRTLALTLFGDLDISIISELPAGRKKIATEVAYSAADRTRIYELMRKQIRAGRQAYVVVPLIDESDTVGAKAVKLEHERLDKEIFPELTVGLLHGRLKSSEKDAVMASFAAGQTSVLVSTPVIEVGIDVPNATIMLIESAERFGLSQLHQFRGRVGRGEHESYCFVLPGMFGKEVAARLRLFAATSDGFALAQEDLKLRGPGEVFGFRQSGMPDFQAANLGDSDLIYRARAAAERMLASDPSLDRHPVIKNQIQTDPFLSLD